MCEERSNDDIIEEVKSYNKSDMCTWLNGTDTHAVSLFMDLEIRNQETINDFNSKSEEDKKEILEGINNNGLHIIKPSKNPGGSPNG